MKIKEVIVVEGKSDTAKIKQAVQADTIETNGSAVNAQTLTVIKHAREKRGVIIFTDPDYPGDRIRHIIDEQVPGCKHAFLMKDQARSSSAIKSIGIEHATIESIQTALEKVYEIAPAYVSDIRKQHLLAHGLIGGQGAKEKRERLGTYLHIGYANGKQLLHRLQMFQITKNELDRAMVHILEGGSPHV